MKKIVNFVVVVGFIVVLATYSSCKKDPDKELPATDQQLQKFFGSTSSSGAGTLAWKLSSATLDGVDKTTDYTTAFTLTLSGTIGALATAPFNYTTSKPVANLSPWGKSGTFTFDATTPATKITRDDTTVITYSVNDTQLQISFTFSGTGYDRTAGRTEVVKGAWVFNFTK